MDVDALYRISSQKYGFEPKKIADHQPPSMCFLHVVYAATLQTLFGPPNLLGHVSAGFSQSVSVFLLNLMSSDQYRSLSNGGSFLPRGL